MLFDCLHFGHRHSQSEEFYISDLAVERRRAVRVLNESAQRWKGLRVKKCTNRPILKKQKELRDFTSVLSQVVTDRKSESAYENEKDQRGREEAKAKTSKFS